MEKKCDVTRQPDLASPGGPWLGEATAQVMNISELKDWF